MPAVHKKGALFAIHQDSPPKSHSSNVNKTRDSVIAFGKSSTKSALDRSVLGVKNKTGSETERVAKPLGEKTNAMDNRKAFGIKDKMFPSSEAKKPRSAFKSSGTSNGIHADKMSVKTDPVNPSRSFLNASSINATGASTRHKLSSASSALKSSVQKSPARRMFKSPKTRQPCASRLQVEQQQQVDENDIYSKPTIRKKKAMTQSSQGDSHIRTWRMNTRPSSSHLYHAPPAPVIPSASTFEEPLFDDEPPRETDELEDEATRYALPAFPVSNGLFGPLSNEATDVFGAESNVQKENVPPVGESLPARHLPTSSVAAASRQGPRRLASAFDLNVVASSNHPTSGLMGESRLQSSGLGLGIHFGDADSDAQDDGNVQGSTRAFQQTQASNTIPPSTSQESVFLPRTESIHGLGFGFTPLRKTAARHHSRGSIGFTRHERGMSSASGINHFLPPCHSFNSSISGSPDMYSKAKVTPLKSRTRKRLVHPSSGSGGRMGHRRGASSASLTNHFLPPSTSTQSGLGNVGEEEVEWASPTARAASVTPLKSRRAAAAHHLRKKSSLDQTFAFGNRVSSSTQVSSHGRIGLGISHMGGTGFSPRPMNQDDDDLRDLEQEPSLWESASSKQSSQSNTSSLGSTTKRFWGLGVEAETLGDQDMDDSLLRGSPVSKRGSSRMHQPSPSTEQRLVLQNDSNEPRLLPSVSIVDLAPL